jgi:hypothetical protein
MASKKTKNYGQRWLSGIEQGVEDAAKEQERPFNMPTLHQVRAEVARLGLPELDADYIFDSWLANGFRSKAGPIKNFKAAIRIWYNNERFPSQRKAAKAQPAENLSSELARVRRMKHDA